MKLTSYKFWYITRDDDGFITDVAIRFYEGAVKTMPKFNDLGEEDGTEDRYVREKQLKKADLPHLTGFVNDADGNDCKKYTQADFGQIKEDDELRVFLNKELKKDTARECNNVQKEEDLEKLKKLKIK